MLIQENATTGGGWKNNNLFWNDCKENYLQNKKYLYECLKDTTYSLDQINVYFSKSLNYTFLVTKYNGLQGVQQNCSHLVICSFVGFYSCKMKKLGKFWKIQEICYMIGTRHLKIDLEIAEIIEVKVGTFNTKIILLTLCNSKI